MLDDKRNSDKVVTDLTSEQIQAVLQKFMGPMLEGMVKAQTTMNPMEQEKYEEEVLRKKRKALFARQLGTIEAEAAQRKKNACSHSRDKQTGEPVAKGQGEWTTGGQPHGQGRNITLGLICTRCQTEWNWIPNDAELERANNQGMMGMQPPSEDRLLREGA